MNNSTILKSNGNEVSKTKFNELALDNGIDLSQTDENIVGKNIKDRIANIVGKGSICSLITEHLKYNIITLENTDGGIYSQELELKVKNTTPESIEKYIGKDLVKDKGYSIDFQGKIADVYYTLDKTLELGLQNLDTDEKCSLRIREKIKTHDKDGIEIPEEDRKGVYLCTMKIKDRIKEVLTYTKEDGNDLEIKFRKCFEEEFILRNPLFFLKSLLAINLFEYKSKFKNRRQYFINKNLVLDCDDYKGEKPLIEFETLIPEVAANYMEEFGLLENEMSSGGSGTLDKDSEVEILRYRKDK